MVDIIMNIDPQTKDWHPESNVYRGITLLNTNGKLVALGMICNNIQEVDALLDKSYSIIQKSIKNDRV